MPVTCWMNQIGAADDVRHQMTRLNDVADQTVSAAIEAADDLLNYQVPNLTIGVALPSAEDYAPIYPVDPPDFNTVELPDLPDFPAAPTDSAPAAIVRPDGPPDAPAEAPAPNIPPVPFLYDPSFTLPPTLIFPDAPVFGDATAGIPVPVLREIVLPDAPDIDIDAIVFNSVRPTFTAIAPDADDFAYVDAPYEELMITQIKARIEDMLDGNTGLPAAVENAIWERAAEREDAQALRAEQEVYTDMGRRGFGLPNGVLNALLNGVQQKNQDQRATLSREVMIQIHKEKLEMLKFGVAQGIALEDLWVRLFTTIQDRKLQAARFAIDIAIAVFNARVAQFQAEGEMYKIDAEIYKTRIEAELAKLQVYAEQIKAQALIGDINEQDIKIYTARLQAVDMDVRIFLGLNESRKTTIEAELAKLTAFKTSIEIESTKLEASKLRLDAWRGQLEGEQLTQEVYKTRTQGYMIAVQAWQTEYQAEVERFKGDLALLDSNTQRFEALVNAYAALGNYEKSRADIAISDNTSRAQLYSALTQGNTGYNSSMIERVRLINETIRAQTEVALKNGEINITNAMGAQQLMIRAQETGSQVLASLGSGAMSAANVNASINDSTNSSLSCSTSISSIVD